MEKEKKKKTEDESVDDTDDEKIDDESVDETDDETDDEIESSKPDPESREAKVKKRIGYLKRKPEELEKLVGLEVDMEEMKLSHNETKRELNIERAMKKFNLDEEAASLITGTSREEVFASAKKVRALMDKSAKTKTDKSDDDKSDDDKSDGDKSDGEKKKRIEDNPDLKDADELDESVQTSREPDAVKKRFDAAKEKLFGDKPD